MPDFLTPPVNSLHAIYAPIQAVVAALCVLIRIYTLLFCLKASDACNGSDELPSGRFVDIDFSFRSF
jgi:hypothetical protein